MIVVADTSPINYLLLIEKIAKVFEENSGSAFRSKSAPVIVD
jgi:hypothetical protein